jgi:hypothetical protein
MGASGANPSPGGTGAEIRLTPKYQHFSVTRIPLSSAIRQETKERQHNVRNYSYLGGN